MTINLIKTEQFKISTITIIVSQSYSTTITLLITL